MTRARDRDTIRLEPGDLQHAALAFNRKHGFVDVPRFGPFAPSGSVYRSLRFDPTLEGNE